MGLRASHTRDVSESWQRRSQAYALPALLLVSLAGCWGPIGEEFKDVDGIGLSETWQDWVVVGRFGPKGPFTLVDVKTCEVSEPCNFSHDGQGHTYSGFYGFKITVLRLEGPDGVVSHVVLRSKQK